MAALVTALFLWPEDALAQRAPVLRALADLRTVLDGTYGDEGGEVAGRLAAVSAAAANWDRSIRDAELELRARLGAASAADAALAHEALGSMYVERGRFDDAITQFDAASRLAPQRSALHLSRAFALDASGSPDRAVAAFRQAWTLDPDNPVTAYLAFARSAIDGADLARARDTLLRAVQSAIRGVRSRPPLPFPHPALSINESSGALVSLTLFPLARYADGFAHAMRGQLDEAVARLREAAGSDPLIVDPASDTGGLQQAADSLRRGSLYDRGRLCKGERRPLEVAIIQHGGPHHSMLVLKQETAVLGPEHDVEGAITKGVKSFVLHLPNTSRAVRRQGAASS